MVGIIRRAGIGVEGAREMGLFVAGTGVGDAIGSEVV